MFFALATVQCRELISSRAPNLPQAGNIPDPVKSTCARPKTKHLRCAAGIVINLKAVHFSDTIRLRSLKGHISSSSLLRVCMRLLGSRSGEFEEIVPKAVPKSTGNCLPPWSCKNECSCGGIFIVNLSMSYSHSLEPLSECLGEDMVFRPFFGGVLQYH